MPFRHMNMTSKKSPEKLFWGTGMATGILNYEDFEFAGSEQCLGSYLQVHSRQKACFLRFGGTPAHRPLSWVEGFL